MTSTCLWIEGTTTAAPATPPRDISVCGFLKRSFSPSAELKRQHTLFSNQQSCLVDMQIAEEVNPREQTLSEQCPTADYGHEEANPRNRLFELPS